MIHRDIKPGNILLDKGRDRIKITDFGLARATDDASITQSGVIAGTPLYMSPEQVDGKRGIDERSDVFSVGVVLYESLALREPFRGQDIDETFNNIKHAQIPTPSERSPEAALSPEIDAIVMKALQKKPSDRFQTMRDLIAALRAVV